VHKRDEGLMGCTDTAMAVGVLFRGFLNLIAHGVHWVTMLAGAIQTINYPSGLIAARALTTQFVNGQHVLSVLATSVIRTRLRR